MPKKDLVGQEVQGPVGGPTDLAGDPSIVVVIRQYLYDSGDREMGGLKGLEREAQCTGSRSSHPEAQTISYTLRTTARPEFLNELSTQETRGRVTRFLAQESSVRHWK